MSLFGASAHPQLHGAAMPQNFGGMDPNMIAFIQAYMNQKQQPPPDPMAAAQADVARLSGLRNDPQGDANKAYIPGKGGPGSPWAEPLQFRPVEQMQHDMAGYGQAVGIPGRTDAATNPYAFGAISTTPDPVTPWQGGVNPTLHNAGGGMFEGMINPGLPDAQKYGDANMFGIQPGISSLHGNQVIGDENGPQYTSPQVRTPAKKKKAASSPLSGFSYGAK